MEICEATDMDPRHLLEANFHSTQDVQYSIHKGRIYGVFTHWLSELSERELDAAFYEILQLAQNTLQGDYYSGDMVLVQAYKETLKERITLEKVRSLWRRSRSASDPRTKGKIFEDFVSALLSLEPGFQIMERRFRTINEEIDILIKNKVVAKHWLKYGSPYIMVECKNWSHKVEARQVRDFAQKIENHIGLCNLGLFFSATGFEQGCWFELVGLRRTSLKIALLDSQSIDRFLRGNRDLKEFLEDNIRQSMKRPTGKPADEDIIDPGGRLNVGQA